MLDGVLLALWALSCLVAAFASWGAGWAVGFRRGRTWAQGTWDGVDRRGQPLPPPPPSPQVLPTEETPQ
jgi:hypothetical protein